MIHMSEKELAANGRVVVGDQALPLEGSDLTVERVAQLSDEELYAIGKNPDLEARSDQQPTQRFAYRFVVVD